VKGVVPKRRSKAYARNWARRYSSLAANKALSRFLDGWRCRPKVTLNKLSYLAGLIDGEGYLKLEKHGSVRITIGMTSRAIMYWLKAEFGGTLSQERILPSGKRWYVWRLNGTLEVVRLLIEVSPYLILKRCVAVKLLRRLATRIENNPLFYNLHGVVPR
jgi:hypothetical protein